MITDIFVFEATFYYFLIMFSIFCRYIFAQLSTFFWFDFFLLSNLTSLKILTDYIEVRVYPMHKFLPVFET